MKFKLTTEQLNYVTNFFISLAHGEGVNRSTRRNILRLSNKFSPPRIYVDLKPADKQQVQSFCMTGMRIMAEALEKEEAQDRKDHITKVFDTLEQVLNKLEGPREVPTYEIQEAPSEAAATGTDPL